MGVLINLEKQAYGAFGSSMVGGVLQSQELWMYSSLNLEES